MNKHSNPIEFLIDFAWANGADRFLVNNAKDQLKKLQEDAKNSERWLSCEKDLHKLREVFKHPVAYVKINDHNNLYDPRLANNPHDDQDKILPLYSNKQELLTGDWK